MKKVLLFGGTGHLGKEIARVLQQRGYQTTAVVRNKNKAREMAAITKVSLIANINSAPELRGICNGFELVISALGKSVSPFDRSRAGFREIDFDANRNILEDAISQNVKKFVYVSALHCERFTHLEYFRVHHEFSELLIKSGINYSIIKPPALFSAFRDLFEMAKKGRLVNIGAGNKTTNPIAESDLAEICVDSILSDNCIIEAGGPEILSRKQINEIIRQEINPGKKIRNIPVGMIRMMMPLMKLFDRNTYDKIAFFLEVMEHDTIAPKRGKIDFLSYVRHFKTRTDSF